MKRWIRFVSLFYPRGWREEFGDEFDAVLDDVPPNWRVFANVLKGAVEMRISEGTGWMKLVVATALVGALAALGMSFMGPQNYRSSAMLTVMPQTDPVRPEAPEVRQLRAIEHVNEMREDVLSRGNLSSIINDPSLNLYEAELKKMPRNDVIEQMRRDLRIQVISSASGATGPIQVSFSFLYPDRAKDEAAVEKLINNFMKQGFNMRVAQAVAYKGFWQDISHDEHIAPVPPPPTGEAVRVSMLNPATHSPPNRLVFLAWGLMAGLLVGLAILWRRNLPRLAAYAVAGFVLAAGVSFLIPNRFTSTAEMMVSPAQLTEDPLATPPNAPPAVEFLKEVEPRALSSEGLTTIIEDRRLNLYSEERKRKPVEEVVSEMRANLRITPVDPTPGAASAFHISFTYPDRFKTQQAVEAVMNRIAETRQNQRHANSSTMSFKQHVIYERRAGEMLYVLDVGNLPSAPDGPPRFAIALGGLGAGLLLGVFMGRRRRPDPPLQLNSNEIVLSNGV